MANAQQRLSRRTRLFEEDPHCYWCRKELVLWQGGSGKLPLNSATIGHLRSRLDDTRQEVNKDGSSRTVLACWSCNNKRCTEEQVALAMAYRKKLQERSGGMPTPISRFIRLLLAKWSCIHLWRFYGNVQNLNSGQRDSAVCTKCGKLQWKRMG